MANGRIRQSRLPDIISQFGKINPGAPIDASIKGFEKGQDIAAKRQRLQLELDKAKLEMAAKKERERAEKEKKAKLKELGSLLGKPAGSQIGTGEFEEKPTGNLFAPEDTGTAVFGPPKNQEGPAQQLPVASPVPETKPVEQTISRDEAIKKLEAQLDPVGFAQSEREKAESKEKEALSFERDKDLLGIKFANEMKLQQDKSKTKKTGKASALVQRLAAQSKNLNSMIKEFNSFDKLLTKEGFTGKLGILRGKTSVPLDKVSGGLVQMLAKDTFLEGFLKVNPNISTQDELADSLARRIYKTISGDVGNIAFSEGAFAKAFVPSAGESPDRRNAKISRLERFSSEIDKGAAELQKRFNSGELTEEQVELELGNIANDAFISNAKERGFSNEEIQADADLGEFEILGEEAVQ